MAGYLIVPRRLGFPSFQMNQSYPPRPSLFSMWVKQPPKKKRGGHFTGEIPVFLEHLLRQFKGPGTKNTTYGTLKIPHHNVPHIWGQNVKTVVLMVVLVVWFVSSITKHKTLGIHTNTRYWFKRIGVAFAINHWSDKSRKSGIPVFLHER